MVILLKKLKQYFILYLEQIGKTTEKLQETQYNIYQITLQIFYILKIAKQTLESPLKLKNVLENEKKNLNEILEMQKISL